MLKNQKASFYMVLVATVSLIVSVMLFFISNQTAGYPIANSSLAMILSAVAVLCCGTSLYAQAKNGNELIVSFLRIAAMFLTMAAVVILLTDRAVVAGGVFTWNNLDTYAWSAFYTGMACLAFQIVSLLLIVVSGCMKQGTNR